jgi:hypothetical protein
MLDSNKSYSIYLASSVAGEKSRARAGPVKDLQCIENHARGATLHFR